MSSCTLRAGRKTAPTSSFLGAQRAVTAISRVLMLTMRKQGACGSACAAEGDAVEDQRVAVQRQLLRPGRSVLLVRVVLRVLKSWLDAVDEQTAGTCCDARAVSLIPKRKIACSLRSMARIDVS